MYFAGLDIGSHSTKSCIINWEEKLIAYVIKKTGAEMARAGVEALQECMSKASLKPSSIAYLAVTGYGRDAFSSTLPHERATEITCHATGAKYFFPKCRTVIDIGGQDTKAIRLDENGRVLKFVMNDKCAAGTGRFLEVMADALNVKLEDMGELSLKAMEEISITSTCTVFAQSEVISLLAKGKNPTDVIAGLHASIARKVHGLAKQVGVVDYVVITGGVAKNIGVVKALEKEMGRKVYVPPEPQIVGANGGALIAKRKYLQKA